MLRLPERVKSNGPVEYSVSQVGKYKQFFLLLGSRVKRAAAYSTERSIKEVKVENLEQNS